MEFCDLNSDNQISESSIASSIVLLQAVTKLNAYQKNRRKLDCFPVTFSIFVSGSKYTAASSCIIEFQKICTINNSIKAIPVFKAMI